MDVVLVQGNITEQRVDAIVNAANESLLGGGGVDGAIHRAGGPEILAACKRLLATELPGYLPTGEAVATTAGRLPARWVVHTVGPVWDGGKDDGGRDQPAVLRACYHNALRVADELGAGSVAFPLISAGAYGWPVEDALRQAFAVLDAATPTNVTEARLVLFGRSTYDTATRLRAGSG